MSPTLTPAPTERWPRHLPHLDELVAETRSLLAGRPAGHGDEREAVVCELIALDLQLQRIGLRSRWATPSDADRAELLDCSRRLDHVRAHWADERPEGPTTDRRPG